MTESHDKDAFVFVSYAHADHEKVSRLIDELVKEGIDVWWDGNIEPGSPWRNVIQMHLDRAVCTLVVWTRNSVDSDFVRSETALSSAPVPVKLDADARIPVGFTEYQYADLTMWSGGKSREFDKLVVTLRRFIARGPKPVDGWTLKDPQWQVGQSVSAVSELREKTTRLRSIAEVSTSDAKASEDLRATLGEIDKTYRIVNDAIKRFLAPAAKKDDIDPAPYLDLERDDFRATVDRGRGHCSLIALHYGRRGGLRDWLAAQGDDKQLYEADKLFASFSECDADAFARMVSIADLLKNQSREIVNLLYAEQPTLARERIRSARETLVPLETELSQAMRELQEIRVVLGYPGNSE